MIKKSGYPFIFLAGVSWGSLGIFVTQLSSLGIPTATIAVLRLFYSAVILFLILFMRNGKDYFKIDRVGLMACIALGVFAQGLFNFCYNIAISNLGVAVAAVLLYTAPVFVCIASIFLFREKMSAKKYVALIINLFGCFFTVTGGVLGEITFSIIGVIFGILSGFLYSLITIIGKMYTNKYDPFLIVFYSFVFGFITMLFIAKPWEQIELIVMPQSIFWAIAFSAFATILPYSLYMYGMSKNVEASKAPIIASVEVVMSALLGFFVLSENLSSGKFLGIALVLLSIFVMNTKFKMETTHLKN